ncbi:hypothetical protein GCM10009737_26150 [Nocardioides lentus]|uniref:Sensor-like histidine kinase SenX3 n=1 Tax=Nocardioides lentus TaxID=338077 RepID=A0ABP5AUX7_9ACTN
MPPDDGSAERRIDQSSMALLRATLDAVPDAVLVVAADGRIDLANRRVRTVFGYGPAELEGRAVEVLVPEGVRAAHPRIRASYGRRPLGLMQVAAVRKGGEEFAAELSLAPIRDAVSGTVRTVATVRDITERIGLEREADRVRDQVLATVTHELKTPLTAILGYVELMTELGEDQLGPDARRMLGAVQRNARREFRLVSNLLTVAVSELDRVALVTGPVDVDDLLGEAVSELSPLALTKSLRLVHLTPEAPGSTTVTADRDRLLQVLDNLIGNAVKFSRPGSEVVVRCRPLDEAVVVTVHDEGPGVPVAEQELVFERLYRGQGSIAAETPGAGLGLSIVRAIVEAHHGSVSLEGSSAGTTVSVHLPR